MRAWHVGRFERSSVTHVLDSLAAAGCHVSSTRLNTCCGAAPVPLSGVKAVGAACFAMPACGGGTLWGRGGEGRGGSGGGMQPRPPGNDGHSVKHGQRGWYGVLISSSIVKRCNLNILIVTRNYTRLACRRFASVLPMCFFAFCF